MSAAPLELPIYYSGGPWDTSIVLISPWQRIVRRGIQAHLKVEGSSLFQGRYERVCNVALWMGWEVVPDG